jgi:hypothetical protein
MYDYIYFDLDDTLIQKNPETGKSEVIKRGYENYLYLTERHYKATVRLVTNRLRANILYPKIFRFDDVAGKDDMEVYILNKMGQVPMRKLLNLKNLYIYIIGLYMYKRYNNPKVLYIFFKHIVKGERVLLVDDNITIAGILK